MTVTAQDGDVNDGTWDSTDATITINIGNVAEAPSFFQATYSFSIAENSASGTLFGNLSVTDPQNDAILTITAGNESNAFSVTSNGDLVVSGGCDPFYTAIARGFRDGGVVLAV